MEKTKNIENFLKKDRKEWDLKELKLRLKEIKKLTQAEVEFADIWETVMWTH